MGLSSRAAPRPTPRSYGAPCGGALARRFWAVGVSGPPLLWAQMSDTQMPDSPVFCSNLRAEGGVRTNLEGFPRHP